MIRFFILILSLLLFGNSACADEVIQNRLTGLLPKNSRWALSVIELATGKEITNIDNANAKPLVPGSLIKLFTAGAVLEQKGINLETTILHDGTIKDGVLFGNLYLRGRGNALLSAGDLKDAAQKLAQIGIRKITGNIIADDTFFDTRGLERSRQGAGYAPVAALGMELHTVAIIVTPSGHGRLPSVSVEPANDAVRLAVEARTMATAAPTITVTQLDDYAYRLNGNIPDDSGPIRWRFPLSSPAFYAAGAFKTGLKQIEVKVDGDVGTGRVPDNSIVLVEIPAQPIDELIRNMNMKSLNIVADNLFLLLGAEKFGAPGTRRKGIKMVSEFLDSLSLPKKEVTVADGSGLMSGNLVTARFMAEYLQKVTQKEWYGSFYKSLPKAGTDATFQNIGYKNERFMVKSGRLENAFALAGYGIDGKGREIAFAYIVNTPAGAVMNLEQSGAEVIRYLSTEVLQ